MNRIRRAVLGILLAGLAAHPAFAQEELAPRRPIVRGPVREGIRPCSTDICATSQPSACIEMTNAETAWRTCISNQGRRGLVLGPTDLRRSPSEEWMRVLNEAGVAEIFVPYHELGLRLYDHEITTAASIREVMPADAGTNGMLVTLSGRTVPQVVAETNDRGIAWLCKERRSINRRGRELVLWGVQDAGNYDFIIEYRLRDDGSIGFRLGATGFNNPYLPPESTTAAHTHDVLWRIDVDLNGPEGDTAMQFLHIETPEEPRSARDVEEPFNAGREGVAIWDPETLFTIGVVDESTNAYGNHIGYALRVSSSGTSRHYGRPPREERFTLSDFAVTTYKASERDALFDTAHVRYLQPDQYLLGQGNPGMGVTDAESVEDTNVVLWHRTSAHHHPHDEDRALGDPPDLMTGITNVHWQGVELEPHNLFDANPLGAPSREDCW